MHKTVSKILGFALSLFIASTATATSEFEYWLQAPSNTGVTGMLEMPNARVMEDWNMRLSLGYSDPYVYYSGALTLLPSLEIAGRMTQSINVDGGLGDEYGDYKDKNVDIKWQLFGEGELLPAFAIGANDIHGTGLYTSRYFVFSKQWSIFDFTLGYGQGRMGGEPIEQSSAENSAATKFIFSGEKDGKVFGGIRARITDHFSLIAEYDTIEYHKDAQTTITEEKNSNINYGLRYSEGGLTLGLHYLRGDEIGLSAAVDFAMKPATFYEPPYTASKYMKKRAMRTTDLEKRAAMIHNKLRQRGFTRTSVHCQDDYVWVEFYNGTYLSETKAMGRVARVAAELSPETTTTIYVSLLKSNHNSFTMAIPRNDIESYVRGEIDSPSLTNGLAYTQQGSKLKNELVGDILVKEIATTDNDFTWGISPKIESFLNDPNGFYLYRLSLLANAAYTPWENGLLKASLRIPIYSNIVDKAQNLEGLEPVSVRSDSALYLDDGPPRFEKLGLDQIFTLPFQTYANISAGYLDYAYAGGGGEILSYFFDGRLAIGLEYAKAYKRDPESAFGFYDAPDGYDNEFDQHFINLYYNISTHYGVDLSVKYGQFLGGDKGVKASLSRTYRHFSVGFWYTATNGEDVFTNSLNHDYDDKGVFISFPFRAFPTDRMRNNKVGYLGFTPWGRDVGATVPLIRSAYNATRNTQPYFIKNDLHQLGD